MIPTVLPFFGSSPRVRGKQPLVGGLRVLGRIIPARAGQTAAYFSHRILVPDHPRACGANPALTRAIRVSTGSSPRVRGKRQLVRDCETYRRIIPARAGQTSRLPLPGILWPDHPRACGANSTVDVLAALVDGSSPRVRGKLIRGIDVVCLARIIPARAGQTLMPSQILPHISDHPRACGANDGADGSGELAYGSSPRVRGKPRAGVLPCRSKRIIPARAGQTDTRNRCRLPRPDHPRACGANLDAIPDIAPYFGSSPRVRGKRRGGRQRRVGVRIIPARAGQTPCWSTAMPQQTDHPRACGANTANKRLKITADGSSPRVRGKLGGAHSVGALPRIIPARAGQTSRAAGSHAVSTDHPRACGANPAALLSLVAASGSSPRVRGKPERRSLSDGQLRIIPARAGQTASLSWSRVQSSDHPRACGANLTR